MAGTRRLSELRAGRRRRSDTPLRSPVPREPGQTEERHARVYAFPVRRSAASLRAAAALLEGAFAAEQTELRLCLAAIENELATLEPAAQQGIGEQVAFIRVGLRCIADAIGELAAHAETANPTSGVSPTDRPA